MELATLLQLVTGVAIFAVTGAVGWTARTISANQRRVDILETGGDLVDKRVADQDGEIQTLKTKIAGQGERLAALQGRSEDIDRLHQDITAVHRRIDDVATTANKVEGTISALADTNAAILRALVGDRAA